MKKILFVISYLDKGGAERALSNITNNMPKDWEIDILVNSNKVIDYEYRGNIISLGIDDTPKMTSLLFHLRIFFKRLWVMRKMKRQNGYAACISFLDSANFANIISGNRYCKSIVSVRSSLQGRGTAPQYRYIANPLIRLFYNRADKVVAVSKGIEKELIELYKIAPEKVCAIPNGYLIDEIRRLSEEKLEDEIEQFIQHKRVIATVGRLSEEKGTWHLIRAFSQVQQKTPEAGLLIVGEGNLSDYLQNLTKEYGIEQNVFFTGFVRNPYKILAKADVYAITSLFEGFPNALAEALCLSIPSIATDFRTGARELLEPQSLEDDESITTLVEAEYGLLTPLCSGIKYTAEVPLEDAEQKLAQALLYMLDEQKNSYYRKKSLEKSRMLDIDSTIQKWLTVILE